MASYKLPMLLFVSALFLQAAFGEIVCEDLPKDVCAFSVAASGKRCLLETSTAKDGVMEYQCRTSEVIVERIADYIESDDCVKACGVDRNCVGISSDALLEANFTAKLCSPICYHRCHNIVDLYFNLAAGEGAFLPDLCDAARTNPHRSMIELMSSGEVAGPASGPAAGPSAESAMSPAFAPSQ
ncbi:PAR1 protein [Euphorbia peplus]|nr:PAR1 protein [Euphorbia peplus]